MKNAKMEVLRTVMAREKFPDPVTREQEIWNEAIDYLMETIATPTDSVGLAGDDKDDGQRI